MINKTPIPLLIAAIILCSCASTYKPINPYSLNYRKTQTFDSVEISFYENALASTKNKKYIRKSLRKEIDLIAVKIENKSSKPIDFNKDLKILLNNNEVPQMESKEVKMNLRQHVGLYYLALLGFTIVTTPTATTLYIGINPFGLLYAVPNSIVAGVANKDFYEELVAFETDNLLIAPRSTEYGIMKFNHRFNPEIEVTSYMGKTLDTSTSHIIYTTPKVSSDYPDLYISDLNGNYDVYYANLVTTLSANTGLKNIHKSSTTFPNGNIRYIGVKAGHNDEDIDREYRIGTWRYFHNNGQVQYLIDFDQNEMKNGRYEEYDQDGNLISRKQFKDNVEVKSE